VVNVYLRLLSCESCLCNRPAANHGGIAVLWSAAFVICGAGVYELFYLPTEQVVLFHLHANVWWGAITAVNGLVNRVNFVPGRERI
jgi:hypothetical protein